MDIPRDPEKLTMREWNALGRRVCKGSKAVGFFGGDALFHRSQTYQPHYYETFAPRRRFRDTDHESYGTDTYWQDECDATDANY